jgi:hypothetical protein
MASAARAAGPITAWRRPPRRRPPRCERRRHGHVACASDQAAAHSARAGGRPPSAMSPSVLARRAPRSLRRCASTSATTRGARRSVDARPARPDRRVHALVLRAKDGLHRVEARRAPPGHRSDRRAERLDLAALGPRTKDAPSSSPARCTSRAGAGAGDRGPRGDRRRPGPRALRARRRRRADRRRLAQVTARGAEHSAS